MGSVQAAKTVDIAAGKESRLRERLAGLPSLIVALSGGTDSAYLAWVARQVLVGARALAKEV